MKVVYSLLTTILLLVIISLVVFIMIHPPVQVCDDCAEGVIEKMYRSVLGYNASEDKILSIIIASVSATMAVVTIIIGVISIYSLNIFEQLRKVRKDYEESFDQFKMVGDRMIVEWQHIIRNVDRIVSQYVALRVGKKHKGNGTSVSSKTSKEEAELPSFARPNLDENVESPISIHAESLELRISLIGLDEFSTCCLSVQKADYPINEAIDLTSEALNKFPFNKKFKFMDKKIKESQEKTRRNANYIKGKIETSNFDDAYELKKFKKEIIVYLEYLIQKKRISKTSLIELKN